jgi:hypothetical protein
MLSAFRPRKKQVNEWDVSNSPILDFVEKGLLDSRFFFTSGRLDEFT